MTAQPHGGSTGQRGRQQLLHAPPFIVPRSHGLGRAPGWGRRGKRGHRCGRGLGDFGPLPAHAGRGSERGGLGGCRRGGGGEGEARPRRLWETGRAAAGPGRPGPCRTSTLVNAVASATETTKFGPSARDNMSPMMVRGAVGCGHYGARLVPQRAAAGALREACSRQLRYARGHAIGGLCQVCVGES